MAYGFNDDKSKATMPARDLLWQNTNVGQYASFPETSLSIPNLADYNELEINFIPSMQSVRDNEPIFLCQTRLSIPDTNHNWTTLLLCGIESYVKYGESTIRFETSDRSVTTNFSDQQSTLDFSNGQKLKLDQNVSSSDWANLHEADYTVCVPYNIYGYKY